VSEARCPGDCCEGEKSLYFDDTALDALTSPLLVGMEDNAIIVSMLSFVRWAGDGAVFECSRFDTKTRLCTRYSERPLMCSEFPYNRPCAYCTLGTLDIDPPRRWVSDEERESFQPAMKGVVHEVS
jgi:Fe-S-cluster containining protein